MIRQLPDGYGVKFVLEEGDRTVVIAEVGPVHLVKKPFGRYTAPPLYQNQVVVEEYTGLR